MLWGLQEVLGKAGVRANCFGPSVCPAGHIGGLDRPPGGAAEVHPGKLPAEKAGVKRLLSTVFSKTLGSTPAWVAGPMMAYRIQFCTALGFHASRPLFVNDVCCQ